MYFLERLPHLHPCATRSTPAGLIQIVGQGYGAEPPMVDANYGRVSYTQFEFLYAREKKKKTRLSSLDKVKGCKSLPGMRIDACISIVYGQISS
jgi:hypothetical protein